MLSSLTARVTFHLRSITKIQKTRRSRALLLYPIAQRYTSETAGFWLQTMFQSTARFRSRKTVKLPKFPMWTISSIPLTERIWSSFMSRITSRSQAFPAWASPRKTHTRRSKQPLSDIPGQEISSRATPTTLPTKEAKLIYGSDGRPTGIDPSALYENSLTIALNLEDYADTINAIIATTPVPEPTETAFLAALLSIAAIAVVKRKR